MTRKEALKELMAKVEAGERFIDTSAFPDVSHQVWIWEAFKGSLDAAKALHEAVLPERSCGVTFGAEYGATVTFPPTWEAHSITCSNENPARAWLIAIIKALISEETP